MSVEITEEQSKKLLHARSIFAIYKGSEASKNVVALSGINLDLETGEFVAIVGPSGSGKSSMLRILGGLQHPSAGHVFYEGLEISKLPEDKLVPFRRATVGYVFQEGNLIPYQSAYTNIYQTLRFTGTPRSIAKTRTIELFEQLGIKHRMNALPARLSGGERQRVSIARALANEPKVILADEPTGNLDFDNSDAVMGLFQDLHRDNNTAFIVVTHSRHISKYADRSIELRDGRFVGEHGKNMDYEQLELTRKVIIQPDGTLTLPEELLHAVKDFGNLWEFTLDRSNGTPKIIGTPAQEEQIFTNCPVCKSPVEPNTSSCPSCGAQLLSRF